MADNKATDTKQEEKKEKKPVEVKEAKKEEKAPAKKSAKKEKKKKQELKFDINDLEPGMTVRIHQKIKELNIKGEEKERIQYFEGMVIAKKHGKEVGGTITVRKVSNGVGVEKIFPINLPTIEKVEIKKKAKVRQSKLYFLRGKYKKRLKETIITK